MFVDFNQNAPHKTVFGAWSIRARAAAEVSTPFEWDELDDIDPEACTALTVPDRVDSRGDPWADIADDPQVLTPLLEMYDRDIESGLEDAPWPPVYPKMPGEPPRVAPEPRPQGRRRQPHHATTTEEAHDAPARSQARRLLDAAGVSVSTGSACQAGIPEPSHVLLGMGLPADAARGALRITIGHTSTDADVDALLAALPTAVARATTAGYADRAPVLGTR